MKRLLFISILFGVFACTQTPGYKIKVKIEGAEGTIVIEQRKSGAFTVKDSAQIVKGVAVLKGSVEFPDMYYLSVKGERRKLVIFIENSNISVVGKIDSISNAKVTGSSVQDEFISITLKMEGINNEGEAIIQESQKLRAAGDTQEADQLMKRADDLERNLIIVQEDFIKNHPVSYVSPYILSNIQYEKNEVEIENLLNVLDPKLNNVPTIVALRERVEKMKTVAVGKSAPDFTQNDPEGNPIKFSDVYSKNKYTLVDFWASWCGPCRQENPNVVAVYSEFKSKGFNVFGVSLDRSKENWLKAIQDDGLVWQHVSDLAYWDNAVAALYAVNFIPANLLVDKEGKIIAKNLKGNDLRAKIAELLN